METQICVLQSFFDLKEKKYSVYVPIDIVTSLRSFERTMGIKRL
jgi:nicotinamidase-related amidase